MDHSALPETQEPMKKSRRFLWPASALIVLLLLAAAGVVYTRYSLRRSCEVNAVKETSTILVTQLKMYDGVFQVAVTASRDAPDHPVNTLKQILMDTQEVDVPACMQTAKQELVDYMGTVILAFDAYRSGEADATVRGLVQQSDGQYANFRAELKAVNECAPYCMR